MQKILFHLNSLEKGGAERVVTTLANYLVQVGYEVVIVTLWKSDNEFWLDKRIERIDLGIKEKTHYNRRILGPIRKIYDIRKIFRNKKPDVVIAFAKKAICRALLATFLTSIPVIISVRTNPYLRYNSRKDKILVRFLFPRAAGSVFQTEEARRFFPKSMQKKAVVILNPVHSKYTDVQIPVNREKCVVQTGRLAEMKNQIMLIKAFINIHSVHPEYILKIYGGDSKDGTKEKLEACIKEYNAQEYVFLMGESDCLEKEIVSAAIYTFTSDWEGVPNALIEAMVMGLPVISTDCAGGGAAMLIEDGVNGLLIPAGNQTALEEKLLFLIENEPVAKRLGENARRLADKVNEKAITQQWTEYIDEIVKGK